MRTHTPADRTLIAAAHVNHYVRVEVENADRTYVDLTTLEGIDWVDSVQWGESEDQSTGSATVTFKRDTSTPQNYSLSPIIGGSPLNRNNAGAYAPLLETGRNLRISTAVTANGVAPVSADWKVMFIGRIDSVKWDADPVTVQCRDLAGWIADRYIEEERAYATTAPTPIETVMAQILTDWPPFGAPALYTPVSPGWIINNTAKKTQARKSVLEALQQDLALSIGGACRYRFDAADNYRLTFYLPDRTTTTPIDSFGPDEYRDITSLELADVDVRNRIVGKYFDADGTLHTRTQENATSQTKYGIRFMEIQLAQGDPIDTDDEMDRLLVAAASDLGLPFATQELETFYYWLVQLGDVYEFQANAVHYDDPQGLAVVGYTHKFQNGQGLTTLQCRGNVAGAYHQWFQKSNNTGASASSAPALILRVSNTESADATGRDILLTVSPRVDTVHVHYRTVPIDASGDLFDFSESADVETDAGSPLIVRKPSGSNVISFALKHPPRDFKLAARMVPYTTDLVEGINWPLEIAAAPPAVNSIIHVSRNDGLASLGIEVLFGPSDGPVTVDVFEDTATVSTNILSTVLTQPTTPSTSLDGVFYPSLSNRQLPDGKDSLSWRVRVTDVSGEAWWFGPATANRDPAASGSATVQNFRAGPVFVVAFDADTDSVRITNPSLKQKTWTRAQLDAAGSPVSWAATDPFDDASTDPALAVDETRGPYIVEIEGGGVWSTIWHGDLHGQPSNPPTADIRATPNAARDAMDVHITPDTQVNEQLHVYWRDGATDTALEWILCVSAGDPTALAVTAGTVIGPSNFFRRVDGVGSPTAKLSAIPLVRDQVARYGVMIEGADSGIQSPWLDVVLSLMEQPWLESVTLKFDPATNILSAIIVAGAHTKSVGVLFADNASFSAPITASGDVDDGNTLTLTTTLSDAQLGKPWHAKVTPFNAITLGGLPGAAQQATVDVPAVFSLVPTTNEAAGVGTVTLVLTDNGSYFDPAWTNSTITGAISWEILNLGVKTVELSTTHPGSGTSGTYTKNVTLDPKHPIQVNAYGHLVDGSTVPLGSWVFDIDKVSDVVNAVPANNGSTATVTVKFDTDTKNDASGTNAFGRYSLNGGSTWTTFNVPASLLAQFNITRSSAKQTVTIEGLNAYDGAWGRPNTVEIDALESSAATPQGTGDVDSNGVVTFSVDLPPTVNSIKYLGTAGTTFPTDASTVSGGVLVSTPAGGLTTLAGLTLSFGQTECLTIVPFTGASGTGTQLQSIHLRAAYLSYTASKTVTFSPGSFVERTQPTLGYSSDANGNLMCGSASSSSAQIFDANIVLPSGTSGVTVTQVACDMYWTTRVLGPTVVDFTLFRRTGAGAGASIASGSATSGANWQTLTVATSENTAGRGYQWEVHFTVQSGSAGAAGVGVLSITYTMGDPKQTL